MHSGAGPSLDVGTSGISSSSGKSGPAQVQCWFSSHIIMIPYLLTIKPQLKGLFVYSCTWKLAKEIYSTELVVLEGVAP